MKQLLLVLACSFLSSAILAQKKLKAEVNKETGDTTWSTGEQRIYVKAGSNRSVGEYLKTRVYKSSNNYVLCLAIQTGRTSVFTISEGASANFELEDGSTVVVNSMRDYSSRPSSLDYGSWIFSYYLLTAASIQQLKASPLKQVRVSASMGPMEYIIKAKQSATLQEQLSGFE